jgi:hypothetical protein
MHKKGLPVAGNPFLCSTHRSVTHCPSANARKQHDDGVRVAYRCKDKRYGGRVQGVCQMADFLLNSIARNTIFQYFLFQK